MFPIILAVIFFILLIDFVSLKKALYSIRKLRRQHKKDLEDLSQGQLLEKSRKKTKAIWFVLLYIFTIIGTVIITLLVVHRLPLNHAPEEEICTICMWLQTQYVWGYISSIIFFLCWYFQWLRGSSKYCGECPEAQT